MKSLSLKVGQRLQLASMLPQKSGSLAEMISIGALRKEVMLTPDEAKALDMQPGPNGGIRWNALVARTMDKQVSITPEQERIIGQAFVLADQAGEVPTTDEVYELYLMFQDAIEQAQQLVTVSEPAAEADHA